MEKKYFIKYHVIEQAERMVDKYAFLAEEKEYAVREQNLSKEEAEKNFAEADKLYTLSDKLHQTILNCCEGRSYKGTWEQVQFLTKHAQQRDCLDALI